MNNSEEHWEFIEEHMDTTFELMEKNAEAQSAFIDTWLASLDGDTMDPDAFSEGIEGYTKAYQRWMDGADKMLDLWKEVSDGEDVEFEEFRDIYLRTANDAFKDIMETTAFASAIGETVGSALEIKKQMDDAANDTLHELGFATAHDLSEVAERLVEVERRQKKVEDLLTEIRDEI